MAFVVPRRLARRFDEEHPVAEPLLLGDDDTAHDGSAVLRGPAAHGRDDQPVGRFGDAGRTQFESRGEHFGQHDDIGIGGGHDRLQTFQVPGGVFPLHIDLTDSYAYFHRELLFCNKYMKFSYSLHFLQEKSETSYKTSRKFHAIRAYRRGAA